MALRYATVNEVDEVYKHFYNCREWFPHIRKDYIRRMIIKGKCIYEDGVIITFTRYTRKQKIGTKEASRGDVILHQILNSKKGSGAAERVIQKFFHEIASPVWLTVRAENARAIAFYKKVGMQLVGKTSWLKGQIKGLVFLKLQKQESLETFS